MNNNNQTASHSTNTRTFMPWYKVPIMWLMIGLLGFTVIGGINLFILAHDTNDSVITDQKYKPLDKKQALSNTSKSHD